MQAIRLRVSHPPEIREQDINTSRNHLHAAWPD